jgi:Zn-dependent M28 family amino/carboxypeptidase
MQNPFLSVDQKIMGDTYTSSEPMENLVTLCDRFGSRFGGTPGERQAAEFFRDKMVEYGLSNAKLESVDYTGWMRGSARLEIISPIERTVPCISLPHSPPASMEGVIIDMGDGAPQDFDHKAAAIRNHIVMTTSVVNPKQSKRWIHRAEKYGRSILAGATGFVFVNHYPGFGPATGGIGHDGQGHIPAISISKEDGAYLQRLMKCHGELKIRLATTDRCKPMTSWNILGDLPGKVSGQQVVMLGCHYDGHDISQGAADPASGAVSVLEAARVLGKYAPDLPHTIRFAFWGIEEIGLLGSREYVKAHADELSQIRFYLNMDAAGARTNNRDVVLNEWPDLEPSVQRWRDEMALDFSVAQSVSAFSDHFPFFMAGVPTGGIQSAERSLEGRGYGHTRFDTVDKVELADLREASTLAARLAMRFACDENWPVARRDEKVVLDLLDTPDYQEEQAFRERLAEFYQQARSS